MVDTGYPRHPDAATLLPGAAEAIARLNARGVPVIVITNQSGIARGLMSEADYVRVRERLDTLLAARQGRLDATYHCPHHPDYTGPCDCRKPATALFERAARDLGIALDRAAFVGDRWRDVSPALSYGATAILIRSTATGDDEATASSAGVPVVDSLADAVDLLTDAGVTGAGPGTPAGA
jgi:D-glycero-D-manno-heptose 1,7-bisphosphate phosphatase